VSPAEVEAAIDALSGVRESAVVGVPDETWGEVGLAYVVPTEPGAITAAEVSERLRGAIAGFKIPRWVRIVDHIPRTATGKIMRAALDGAALDEDAPPGAAPAVRQPSRSTSHGQP